jgi:peptidoglycan/xylan/chitin deacetylase (PgdA/CDA1 family)
MISLLTSVAVVGQQRNAVPQSGTLLSLDQLRKEMFHVSVGRRLIPASWPNGAKVAVALSFDVDNATTSLAIGEVDSLSITLGEYGAVSGLPRVLRILAAQNVPASFYIPAVSALLHPQMIKEIQASGKHEIGVHGWVHENLAILNNEFEEHRLLTQAIDALTQLTGQRPIGYRAPSWIFSQFTMKQIKEAGFLYDSSLFASDDAYEILLDGQPTGVIELPISGIRDDVPYLGQKTSAGSLPDPDRLEKIFESEFDIAYTEGGLFTLTMHPHVTGHRAAASYLEKLFIHMKSKPNVWFATGADIARYLKNQ